MTTKKYVRAEDGERIDQPDFQFGMLDSQVTGLSQIGEAALVGVDRPRAASGDPAQPRNFVLQGFEVRAQASGTFLEVDGGIALVGYRRDHQIEYGAVSSGPTMKLFDVGGLSPAGSTYTVYVRMKLAPAEGRNRAFWNSAGAPPVEYVRNTDTRYAEDWEITADEGDPGDEWLAVATVVPATMTVVKTRNFFFEPRDASFVGMTIEDADWGGGNDRNNDRATYGVFGLARFAKLVTRQLQDALGTVFWAPISLESSLEAHRLFKLDNRGRSATSPPLGRMYGHLDPDAGDTYDLGDDATPRRWRTFFGRAVTLGRGLLGTAANAILPRIDVQYASGFDRTLVFQSHRSNETSGGLGSLNVYRSYFASERAYNCFYNDTTQEWDHYDDTSPAFSYYESIGTRYVRYRPAGAGNWTDAQWTTLVNGSTADTRYIQPLYANSFHWNVTKTGKRGLSAFDILSTSPYNDDLSWVLGLTGTASKYFRKTSSFATVAVFMWSIHVPNGVTLTRVAVTGLFTLNGGSIEAQVIRIKTDGTVEAVGTQAGLSGALAEYALDVSTNPVINNDDYSYAIWFTAAAVSTLTIYRGEVHYDTGTVLP